MRFSLQLLGGVTLEAGAEDAVGLLELCRRRGSEITDASFSEDGGVRLSCTALEGGRILRACPSFGVRARIVRRFGIPHFLYLHRKRAGLLFGILAALFLFGFSRCFVWDVRVTGNVRLRTEAVLSELSAVGLSVGSYLPDIDARSVENRLLSVSEELSWASVRLNGTVVEVQVRERESAEESLPSGRPANLIASADGQIEQLAVFRGKTVVSVGQAIKKGDLLVSGVYDSRTQGYRYTRASGSVFARTEKVFRVEVPLTYTQKVYQSAKTGDVTLKFFGFSIKILKSTGNEGGSCDIIKVERCFFTPQGKALPFQIVFQRLAPYTLQTATRTAEQALEVAYADLDRLLSESSSECLLLKKNVSTTVTQESVVLTCRIECIENVAVTAEFDVTE